MNQKVLETIRKYNLIEDGDKIVLGVSGGPDSICMLDNLREVKEEQVIEFEIYVAHINHMIREEAIDDEKYVQETIPAMDFIKRLIRHIPEKHFKMIRYGGLYARHRQLDSKLYRAIHRSKHHIYRSFNQWRTAILSSFGYDPIKCPDCGHTMLFLELYYNHHRVSLEELYERAMSKSLGKRSSA